MTPKGAVRSLAVLIDLLRGEKFFSSEVVQLGGCDLGAAACDQLLICEQ